MPQALHRLPILLLLRIHSQIGSGHYQSGTVQLFHLIQALLWYISPLQLQAHPGVQSVARMLRRTRFEQANGAGHFNVQDNSDRPFKLTP